MCWTSSLTVGGAHLYALMTIRTAIKNFWSDSIYLITFGPIMIPVSILTQNIPWNNVVHSKKYCFIYIVVDWLAC